MKVRTGFVSNSSSSSFVIAIKKSNPCKCCGRSDLDIIDLINNSNNYDGDTEVNAVGKEQVIKYIQKNWYDGEKMTDLIKEIEATKQDTKVALISISYHNEILNEIVRHSPNIQILYEGG